MFVASAAAPDPPLDGHTLGPSYYGPSYYGPSYYDGTDRTLAQYAPQM